MAERKRHSAASKPKVAFEAIREELMLSELSRKYDVHPNMISVWKRTAIENMASGFAKGKEGEQKKQVYRGLPLYNASDNGEPNLPPDITHLFPLSSANDAFDLAGETKPQFGFLSNQIPVPCLRQM